MHIVRHLVESFGIAATSDPGTGWLAFAGQGPVNEWCLAGHSQKQQELRNKVRYPTAGRPSSFDSEIISVHCQASGHR